MATQPKTAKEFNDSLRGFCKTVSPYPLSIRSTQSFVELVFIELFGQAHVVNILNGKLLTSKNTFIFEDSPTSATGILVKGFTEDQFYGFIKDLEDLEKDPTLKLKVWESYILFLKITKQRQAASRTILQTQLDADDATLNAIGNLFYTFEKPDGVKSIIAVIKNFVHSVNKAKIKGTWKTVTEVNDKLQERVGSSFSILMWGGLYRAGSEMFGPLPCLLGPTPLKHANYIEIARSGKILKFRATGSVFLAAQEGGADAIKIEGTLYKAEYAVMFLLWALFLYGQSKFRDMESIPGFSDGGITDASQIRKLNSLITTNTDLERPTYEFHQTFPFVSKHFIIPNCYIETISIEDKLPLKDTLKYSILLRTYEKPTEVTWMDDRATRISGFKNKTMSAKICEYSLNAGWRFLNYMGWMIDDQEWKIGSAMEEGALDTYYDVDWTSLSSMVYLNLMGAAT